MSKSADTEPTNRVDPSLHPAEQLALLSLVPSSTAGVGDCESALRTIARVRSYLDVIEAEFARRLRQMHDAGTAEAASSIIASASNSSARDGRKKERRSEILDDASAFAEGLASGRISGEHVDALANACAGLDEATRAKVLDSQSELVDFAAATTPARLARELRDLVRLHEHDQGVARDTQQRRDTFLTLKLEQSGMYRVHGLLHPELGTAINTVLNHHVRTMIRTDERLRDEPRGRLTAEALGELVNVANAALAADGALVSARPTAQINVLIDFDTLANTLHDSGVCETNDGAALPAWKVRQLACDNAILPIVMSGDSLPLDVGRAKRFFTRHQRAALRAIYPTCAMPGCEVGFDRCEIHHLNPWEVGGETNLDNGVPLCSHCHHVIHQPGWTTELDVGRTFTVTTPTGRRLIGHPTTANQPSLHPPDDQPHPDRQQTGYPTVQTALFHLVDA